MLRIAKMIPQGFSEAEIRRTDNIMDNRQKDDTQSITKKTEDRVTRTPVFYCSISQLIDGVNTYIENIAPFLIHDLSPSL
jgi:hypothetical protein